MICTVYVVFSVQGQRIKILFINEILRGKSMVWLYGKDYSFRTPGTWSVIREKLLKPKYFSGWMFKYKTVPSFHPPHISLQGSRHVAVWSDTKCHGRSRLDTILFIYDDYSRRRHMFAKSTDGTTRALDIYVLYCITQLSFLFGVLTFVYILIKEIKKRSIWRN